MSIVLDKMWRRWSLAVNKQKVVDIVPLRSFQRREDELDKSDKQRDE